MAGKKWTVIRIPVGSEIHKEIQNNGDVAAWRTLEIAFSTRPKSKEAKAFELFNTFVKDMNDLYMGSEESFEHLRPLIFKRILKISSVSESENLELDEDYYDFLKGM
jgi:hypothetical protein